MSAVTNQIKISNFELFKRILYSFQVLMVGIAIPVLFIIGTSNSIQHKGAETETVKPLNNSGLTTQPVAFLPLVKI